MFTVNLVNTITCVELEKNIIGFGDYKESTCLYRHFMIPLPNSTFNIDTFFERYSQQEDDRRMANQQKKTRSRKESTKLPEKRRIHWWEYKSDSDKKKFTEKALNLPTER
mgnify:CR=1 FL=1